MQTASSVKQTTNTRDALVDFLREFSTYLISSGVSLEEFQGAAKVAFLQSAMEHARLGNLRINQSALAAITGLSRPQVRKILKGIEETPAEPRGRIAQLLDGWRRDPEYWDGVAGPTRLPIRGKSRSFASLVRKYGRDVTHKALLMELGKLKYARVEKGSVVLTPKGLQHVESKGLQQLTAGLAFALRRPSSVQASIGVVVADALYRTPSSKSRLLIRRRLLQSAKAFVTDIKATGDAEASRSSSRKDRMSRASILILTSD